MRYWIEVFKREFMNLISWSDLLQLWQLLAIYESNLTIYERLWDWWSLYFLYWEIDDAYEKIWYVKGYFSHNDDRSFVINDVKSYSYDYDPLWLNVKERRCLCLRVIIFD